MRRKDVVYRQPDPSARRRRRVVRLHVLLFRAGLGPLFRRRILLLHHTGRTSGHAHRTPLKVMQHDPADGSWTVVSTLGTRADWYRNLRQNPKTVIQFGNRHHAVTARFPSCGESHQRLPCVRLETTPAQPGAETAPPPRPGS
ncbi:nitroreductase family deazaflavin-dependent oxidoreductase [Streptomyces physcomitrii]|uniref:nitroreductase family deazaflavin-dependent oxidoreductase n=1 Tax=Streptomyces physcomitrii TaxID=2724184 RepID=UPI00340AC9C3